MYSNDRRKETETRLMTARLSLALMMCGERGGCERREGNERRRQQKIEGQTSRRQTPLPLFQTLCLLWFMQRQRATDKCDTECLSLVSHRRESEAEVKKKKEWWLKEGGCTCVYVFCLLSTHTLSHQPLLSPRASLIANATLASCHQQCSLRFRLSTPSCFPCFIPFSRYAVRRFDVV